MSFTTIFIIAVALAMDAFAVSVASGICVGRVRWVQVARVAGMFGLFQALMPVLGWYMGLGLTGLGLGWVEANTHWIAFGLLVLVGGKMIHESWTDDDAGESCEADVGRPDPTRGMRLVMLAIATSIDALAVGVSLAVVGTSIWLPALVIGVVCAGISAAGMVLGCAMGHLSAINRYAELLGGVTLIAIGVNMAWGG